MSHEHERPAILASIPIGRHAVIEASAGTGKTYTLEHLVIELLLTDRAHIDQILVVTFTEKAAAELRERLRRKLEQMLRPTPAAPRAGSTRWLIGPEERRRLLAALGAFDVAAISTIHAFCQRMLVEHAFAHGRLFEQALVDGRSAFLDAFRLVLREELAREPALRSYLDAWLAQRPLDDLADLLFEISQRRGRLDPPYAEEKLRRALTDLTRLELTRQALDPVLRHAGITQAQTLNALYERFELLRRVLQSFHERGDPAAALAALDREESSRQNGFLSYLLERLRPKIVTRGPLAHVTDSLAALEQALVPFASAVAQQFLPRVLRRLRSEKDRAGHFDFDDMLGLLHEGLLGPGGAELTALVRARYRYALIDEFQDTDPTQWAIFKHLFLDAGEEHALVAIGDPKQAIYGFRGGDVYTYLDARDQIQARSGAVVPLLENYRASAPLQAGLNWMFAPERTPSFFSGRIGYERPVAAVGEEGRGLWREGRALAPIQLFDFRPRRGVSSSVSARETLAERIAAEIKALLSDPELTLVTSSGRAKLRAKDIYVLTRGWKEGIQIGERLRAYQLPFAFYKQDGLFQTSEAEDVRALLLAIAEPERKKRRLGAWQTPFFAVPLEALGRARELSGAHPLMERLLRWKELASKKRFDELFRLVLVESGIVEREILLKSGERALTNYLHIFELLLQDATRSHATLHELAHRLDAYIDGRRLPEGEDGNVLRLETERDAVQIMTQHKAKGLEAAVVFLFGGLDPAPDGVRIFHRDHERRAYVGHTPPAEALAEAREEDERLSYVALTRAKARLYLPYFGPGEGSNERVVRRLEGSYRHVLPILDQAARPGLSPPPAGVFEIEVVEELERRPKRAVAGEPERLASWQPPEALLLRPGPDPALLALRAARHGPVLTSYSRIKATRGGYHAPAELDPSELEERALAVDRGPAPPGPDQLPGGAASGRFLHEVLEEVPLASLAGAPSADFWGQRADVRPIFIEAMRRHDRNPAVLLHAMELIFNALSAPLELGRQLLAGGFASADEVEREMEFLFPIPEADHPAPLSAPATALRIGRGFVKGFIDAVFMFQGKAYVLDWKSDLLPRYDRPTLDAHVAENYRLQAELYTLAVVKLLGLDDEARYEAQFGGTVYCFVRGMKRDSKRGSPGVYFARPSFAEVIGSELDLRSAELGLGREEPR